jgi:hypothetical protein
MKYWIPSRLIAACHMPDTNWTPLSVAIVAGSPKRLSQPLTKAAKHASAVVEANSHRMLLMTTMSKCVKKHNTKQFNLVWGEQPLNAVRHSGAPRMFWPHEK